MPDKSKILRPLKRRCPDCEEKLYLIRRTQKDGGVSYSCDYEECQECGYSKKIANKHDKVDKYESNL